MDSFYRLMLSSVSVDKSSSSQDPHLSNSRRELKFPQVTEAHSLAHTQGQLQTNQFNLGQT